MSAVTVLGHQGLGTGLQTGLQACITDHCVALESQSQLLAASQEALSHQLDRLMHELSVIHTLPAIHLPAGSGARVTRMVSQVASLKSRLNVVSQRLQRIQAKLESQGRNR